VSVRSSAPAAVPESSVSRRERKKLATRQAIRTAALRLFAERGYDSTTVQNITDAADVAPRTFFLHFASKEDVLLGDARRGVEEFGSALMQRPADEDVFTAVRGAILARFATESGPGDDVLLQMQLLETAPHLLGRIFEHYAEFEEVIAGYVAERAGLDRATDAYALLLSSCAMAAVRLGFRVWYRCGGVQPVAEVIGELFDVLGAGLAVQPES
jgi:AcrR family transcriptional regulator